MSREQVEEKLKGYVDPYLEKDLVSAKAVKDIKVDGDKVSIDIQLGFPAAGYHEDLSNEIKELVCS